MTVLSFRRNDKRHTDEDWPCLMITKNQDRIALFTCADRAIILWDEDETFEPGTPVQGSYVGIYESYFGDVVLRNDYE